MAKKYRDTDYLCLSAQIRSRENALLRRSQLDRMLESGDAKQAARILAEQGWESFDPTQPGALDAAILTQREALYRELSGQLPDDAVLAVFRLKYDCHNIKTLIKARGADVSALLLDAGTIPAQELAQRRRESEGWAFLPAPMAHAALDAERVLAETGDARRSDLLVDAGALCPPAGAGAGERLPDSCGLRPRPHRRREPQEPCAHAPPEKGRGIPA